MKSEIVFPSSSPTGVSSEIGCLAARRIWRTFSAVVFISAAISSAFGSRPSPC